MMWHLLGVVWEWIALVAVGAFTLYVVFGILYLLFTLTVFIYDTIRGA